ncbi:MAG: hypothetical protein Q8P92_05140 [Candidatus Daviesbacteria bacterium]|nr:hypothetical protein [Candidatus Daviesbacteria bacterium]
MMKTIPKFVFLILTLTFVILVAALTLILNVDFQKDYITKDEISTAVNQARYLYQLRKEEGLNFSEGPCLTNALMPDWVVDMVHEPRQDIDDLDQNQCAAFREGRAEHFVELDLNGNLVRVR